MTMLTFHTIRGGGELLDCTDIYSFLTVLICCCWVPNKSASSIRGKFGGGSEVLARCVEKLLYIFQCLWWYDNFRSLLLYCYANWYFFLVDIFGIVSPQLTAANEDILLWDHLLTIQNCELKWLKSSFLNYKLTIANIYMNLLYFISKRDKYNRLNIGVKTLFCQ